MGAVIIDAVSYGPARTVEATFETTGALVLNLCNAGTPKDNVCKWRNFSLHDLDAPSPSSFSRTLQEQWKEGQETCTYHRPWLTKRLLKQPHPQDNMQSSSNSRYEHINTADLLWHASIESITDTSLYTFGIRNAANHASAQGRSAESAVCCQ